MMRRILIGLAATAAVTLAGCGSSNAPRRLPQMPVANLLETASLPAFKNADHQSFGIAVLRIPADGGVHTVPVGEYLLARLAESFPPNSEVDNLRLTRWEVACNDEGWFSSTLVCDVVADLSFRLYKRPERMNVVLREKEFGSLSKARASGYTVTRPEDQTDDAFAAQIQAIPDAVAAKVKADLPAILLSSQRRLAF